MSDMHPGEEFEATFAENVTALMLRCVRDAYGTACELHDPTRGSNEMTFGFSLYHFAVHELCRAARTSPDAVRVLSRLPTFRLAVGNYELGCHRVGASARESIWSALPKNEGAACTMVEPQLWLPAVDRQLGLRQARKLVIAHLGNADDGLGAVYLCIPGRAEGDRIAEWAYARCIWIAATSAEAANDNAQAVPADETIHEPQLRRRPSRDTREEDR